MIKIKMKAEPGHYKVSGAPAKLTHTATITTIKRNWWLIALYTAVNLASIYFCSFRIPAPWFSAAVSFVIWLFTTWIGYLMMCKVERITKEMH